LKAQAQLVVYQAAYPADWREDRWEVPTEGHLAAADPKVGQMEDHSEDPTEDPTEDYWEESWALFQEFLVLGLR